MADELPVVQVERLPDALAKLTALPGFPFGGPLFASDLCDHDEDGESVNDGWGEEARTIIAACVNFACEQAPALAALLAEWRSVDWRVAKWRGEANGGAMYACDDNEKGYTAGKRRCADELAAIGTQGGGERD